MEYLALGILSFSIGFAAGRFRQIRGYFRSKALQENMPHAPPSRILRPFTKGAKRKPRVNDDQKAWLVEQGRR